jgi:hypothetical protein
LKSEVLNKRYGETGLNGDPYHTTHGDAMQTFLPYPDFIKSAQCLDYKRLGKQRVECMQLLKALSQGGGWSNHPAAKMWRGYEPALKVYMAKCIEEWIRRGYRNTMTVPVVSEYVLPPWFGKDDFHASHRSNLLRKDPGFYSKFGWTEGSNLPYIWPTL